MYAVKLHFYTGDKFMRIRQNGPFGKFMRFLFIRSSILCLVMNGTVL